VNWGHLRRHRVVERGADEHLFRDAMYYAMTGRSVRRQEAKEIGFVNMHFPMRS
jgi:enoyl-CoA hydratase/carnithine racemase